MAYLNNKKLFQVVKVAFTPAIYQVKTVTPANQESIITADSGYAALSKVILDGILVDPHYSYTTQTDSTIAYTKSVPSGALDIANIDYVGGNSLVWNQLVQNGNFESTSGWEATFGTRSISNNVCTYKVTTLGDDRQNRIVQYSSSGFESISGHKYLVVATCKPLTRNYNFYFLAYGSTISFTGLIGSINQNTKSTIAQIYTATRSERCDIRLSFGSSEKAIDDEIEVYNVTLIDLTQMFGAGNEPTSVDEFKAQWVIQYGTTNSNYNQGAILNVFPTSIDVQDEDGYDFTDIINYVNNQGYDLSLSTSETLYNYVDMATKKAYIRVASVDLGTLNWNMGQTNIFSYTLSILKANSGNVLQSKYNEVSDYQTMLSTDKSFYLGGTNQNTLYIHDSTYTDTTTFKQAMSGVMLNYELATPVEIDLSSLIDTTTLNVSTGILYFENEYNYAVPSSITYLVEV